MILCDRQCRLVLLVSLKARTHASAAVDITAITSDFSGYRSHLALVLGAEGALLSIFDVIKDAL